MAVPPVCLSASFQPLRRPRPRAHASVHPASPISHGRPHARRPLPRFGPASWRILRIALWVSIFQNRFTVKFKVNILLNLFSVCMGSNSILISFLVHFFHFFLAFLHGCHQAASPHPFFQSSFKTPSITLKPCNARLFGVLFQPPFFSSNRWEYRAKTNEARRSSAIEFPRRSV